MALNTLPEVNLDEDSESKSPNTVSGNESVALNDPPSRNIVRTMRPIKNFNKSSSDIWKDEFRKGKHRCVKKMYLSKVWSKYFKKGTTTLIRFGTDNLSENPIPEKECNYFLLSVIIKDYQENSKNYTKQYIDERIMNGYKRYFTEENKKKILKKWLMEKFSEESHPAIMEVYKATNQLKKLETYVQSSEYLITVIDLIMFMSYTKIPILLIYQSKSTARNDGIKLFYTIDSDYYYIIKLRNHKIFMLHMQSLGKNMKNNFTKIKFSKENMTDYLKAKLMNRSTIEDYLASKL